MPEHERVGPGAEELSGRKAEYRAARIEGDEPAGGVPSGAVPSDDAQVASEPMVLQQVPRDVPTPPGRQRSGDPPA